MIAQRNRSSRGTVLVLVVVMVAILSLLAAGQALMTHSEMSAAAAAQYGHEARAAAMSGIHRAMALLMTQPDDFEALNDNPAAFQAQQVSGESDSAGWFFTLYADNLEDPSNVRYGLEDEAGKISLNIATEQMLRVLLNGNEELVACLLDYRDADSNPRAQGAEQDYYDSLPHPYRIKNGPLATLEELLLVKGFDGTVVFGEDANRNGLLEPNENDGEESFPPDDADGQLDRGLRQVATAITYGPNVSNDGQPRINVNTADPGRLPGDLRDAGFGQQTIDFLVAARRANVRFTDPSQLLGMTIEVNDPRGGGRRMQLASGVAADILPLVMDKLTTGGIRNPATGQEILFGRVNLDSAATGVLRALPGLSEDAAQEIVARRRGLDAQTRSTTAWIYTENVVSADVFKQVAPFVTARSYQYRARSFGYNAELGRFCVLEAVIDLGSGRPRITYLRDRTHLGAPFAPAGIER